MRGSSLVDEVRTKKSSKTLPEAEAVKEYPKGKVGAPPNLRSGGGWM